MMWLCHAVFHQFVAHRQRERNVYKTVTMHMANLTTANAKLRAAKAVRCVRDFLPPRKGLVNFLSRARHWHSLTPRRETALERFLPFDAR